MTVLNKYELEKPTIARKKDVDYDLVLTKDILNKYETHCVGVGAWQTAMDLCEDYNLCHTLHGQALYEYFTAFDKYFNAQMMLDEVFNRYSTKP